MRKKGFQPGQSGNPKGTTREILDATWTLKKMSAVERARTFDKILDLRDGPDASVAMRACELLSHYSDGRPMQNLTVRAITSISDLSEDELRAIAGVEPLMIEGKAEETDDSADEAG